MDAALIRRSSHKIFGVVCGHTLEKTLGGNAREEVEIFLTLVDFLKKRYLFEFSKFLICLVSVYLGHSVGPFLWVLAAKHGENKGDLQKEKVKKKEIY